MTRRNDLIDLIRNHDCRVFSTDQVMVLVEINRSCVTRYKKLGMPFEFKKGNMYFYDIEKCLNWAIETKRVSLKKKLLKLPFSFYKIGQKESDVSCTEVESFPEESTACPVEMSLDVMNELDRRYRSFKGLLDKVMGSLKKGL